MGRSILYNRRRWRRERVLFLQDNPLCIYCKKVSKVTAANVVDHIIPHKEDEHLFWDQSNWQPLCDKCHGITKQIEENGGQSVKGYDINGYPIT